MDDTRGKLDGGRNFNKVYPVFVSVGRVPLPFSAAPAAAAAAAAAPAPAATTAIPAPGFGRPRLLGMLLWIRDPCVAMDLHALYQFLHRHANVQVTAGL